MKILLVALNAKYIHSNLALYSLRTYSAKYKNEIKIAEYTINHLEEDILRGIYREQADVIAFSCYIWNIDLIKRIGEEIKQVMPKVKIWLGGPEVSYDPKECLEDNQDVDGIMIGEGEQTFLELADYYIEQGRSLEEIRGIAYKKSAAYNHNVNLFTEMVEEEQAEARITMTANREPLDMDSIPFPYEDLDVFRNKIIYYESSRGCPYSCSYCLSSAGHGVRFRSMELVKKELKAFLDHNITQVKFVDRTFNCNRRHTMELWQFIKENDNGITNFHFEITADILCEEELNLLSTLRPGQVQLEIGVQTTNPDTIQAIHRNVNFDILSKNVNRISEGKNIHQHLDLIAGLPLEGMKDFVKSFNDVYRLKPDQLQLGFLKVLKGSLMELESKRYGIIYRRTAPYEVLATEALDYGELLKLKGVCEMVETYYNSGQFAYSLQYLESIYESPFHLYLELWEYYVVNGWENLSHSRLKRYEILLDFYKDKMLQLSLTGREPEGADGISCRTHLFSEILLMDLCLREAAKNRPSFALKVPDHRTLFKLKASYGESKGPIHIEHFTFDLVAAAETGELRHKEQYILFDYSSRDCITNSARWVVIQ